MGRVIADKYELIAELATSALGTAHSARHVLLGTSVRLTLLPARLADHPEDVAALQAGARAAIRLAHEHIARLLDVGRDGTRYYVVEELVDGPDLASQLGAWKTLPPPDALALVAQLARALAYAHEQGVVHGSVHPGVVLLASSAPVKGALAGFGVDVRWLVAALPPSVVSFLAPERLPSPAGPPRAVDGRADVFSLGQLLVACCGGHPGSGPPLGLGAPPALDALIARATAADPAARPSDMRTFLAEVETVARELSDDMTVVVRPSSAPSPTAPPTATAPPPAATPTRPTTPPAARVGERASDDTMSLPRGAFDDDATVVVRPRAPDAPRPKESPPAAALPKALEPPRAAALPKPAAPPRAAEATRPAEPRPPDAPRARYPLREPDGSGPAFPPPSASPASRSPLAIGAAVGLVVLIVGWYLTRSGPEPAPPPPPPPPTVPAPTAPAATVPAAPLTWAHVEPESAEQTLAPGARLELEAAAGGASDAAPVTYAWSVDGRAAGDGPHFTYAAPAEAGTRAEIVVTASAGGATLERRWQVEVRAENQPPAIASASPESDAVSVAAGAEQAFSVTASDPDGAGAPLVYVWEENGQVRATGPESSWVLRGMAPGETEIRVTVRDAAGASAPPRTWKVTLAKAQPNRPPRIVSAKPPAGSVALANGDNVVLSVRAADPNPDDPMSYRWFVDGRDAARTATFRFAAVPPLGTTHRVEVEVADKAGAKAPRVVWSIEVTPKMTETDARDWVGRLRAAWERKDVATLRLYGIILSDAAADTERRRLRAYDDYRVAVANETVRVNGKYAIVAFDRTEFDGKRSLGSSHVSYEIEKHASGLVAVRGR